MKISKILAGMSAMAIAGSMMVMAASAMDAPTASGRTVLVVDIKGVYQKGSTEDEDAANPFKATLKSVKLNDKEVAFDAGKVKYGHIENEKNDNYRIELYNEYGDTKADDPFTAADFESYDSMDITFDVENFDAVTTKQAYSWDANKKYTTATLGFAANGWYPQDWNTTINVDGDGEYTIHYEKNLGKVGGGFANSLNIKSAEDDDTKANGAVWSIADICKDAGLVDADGNGDVSKSKYLKTAKVTVKVLNSNNQWGNGQIGVSGNTWTSYNFGDSPEADKDVNIDGEKTFEFPLDFTGEDTDSFLLKLEEYGGGELIITNVEFVADEVPEEPVSSEDSTDSTDSDESKVILTDSSDSKTNSAATSSKAANNASNTNPSTGAAALAAVGVALAGAAVVATKKRK